MKRLLVTCLCAATVILVGCELAPPGGTPSGGSTAQTDVTAEQRALLEDIKAIQQQTGQNLEALVKDAQQRAARERSAEGLAGVVEDVMAAQDIIGDAIEAADLQKGTEASAAISRLRGIAHGMLAECPASMVGRHCERALAYLSLSTPRLQEAAAELTTAYDVTVDGGDPAGVQTLLDQAKTHLNSGDAHNASRVIVTIVSKTGGEKTVLLVSQMLAGLDGAAAALDREAWPVLRAELQEVRRMLDDLGVQIHFRDEVAKVQPVPVAVTTPTTTTTTDEAAPVATDGAALATEPTTAPGTVTTPVSPAPAPAATVTTPVDAATAPPVVAPTVAP